MPSTNVRLAVQPRAQQEPSAQGGNEQSSLVGTLLGVAQRQKQLASSTDIASHMDRQQKAVQVRL